ncbi:MAG: winged helix-turn-helix domain-containing protein [Thermoproteota archaeon]
MSLRAAPALIIVAAILSFAAPAAALELNYVYNVSEDGLVSVSITAADPAGVGTLVLDLEQDVVEGTIAVYDAAGNPLPFVVEAGTLLVEAGNATNVVVEYVTMLPPPEGDVYRIVISPRGRATVYLPAYAALAGFNGTPQLALSGERLVILYNKPGTYLVEFTLIPAETTPSPSETLTATSTETAAPTPTQPTPTSSPAQPGGSPTETTSPAQPATQPTTSPPGEARPGEEGVPAWVAALAVALAVVVVAILIATRFLRSRPSSRFSSGVADSVELISSALDERDRAILELLRERGPMGVSEVARVLGISKSTAWRKLQKLVEMGLVRRTLDDRGNPVYSVSS